MKREAEAPAVETVESVPPEVLDEEPNFEAVNVAENDEVFDAEIASDDGDGEGDEAEEMQEDR
jgi:hypothetical protein